MRIGRALIASRVRFYNSTRIPRYTMRFPAGPDLVLSAMGCAAHASRPPRPAAKAQPAGGAPSGSAALIFSAKASAWSASS